jgi:hypothetical protein
MPPRDATIPVFLRTLAGLTVQNVVLLALLRLLRVDSLWVLKKYVTRNVLSAASMPVPSFSSLSSSKRWLAERVLSVG